MPWINSITGGFATGSNESNSNAVMIYNLLSSFGYSFNPICAILGNIGYESGYNPWRWQSDVVLWDNQYNLIDNQTGHAYGLLQFDPAGQYIHNADAQQAVGYAPNFANRTGGQNDGTAQLYYMNYIAGQYGYGYFPTASYPLSFSEFKQSTQSVAYLTDAWLYNYERGTDNPLRKQYSAYWEQNLPLLVNTRRKMPWIYYLRRRRY